MGSADGVVYQQSQNVLLVSCPIDAPNNTITKVTMAGAVTQGFITSNGDQPLGMTFDASGNLYIANSNDLVVTKVTFTGGTPNTPTWFAAGPFGYYGNMGVDSAGNVYISIYYRWPMIVKLTPDNKTSLYASSNAIPGGRVLGCTFSPNGVLLMADAGVNKIETAPPGGGTISPWIDVSGLGIPYDVAVDGQGSVFVNMNTTSVAKYSSSGTQVSASFVSVLVGFFNLIAQPTNLIIPDLTAGKLYSVSSSGSGPVAPTTIAKIALFAVSPAPSGQFYGIDGSNIFLIDPANGDLSLISVVLFGAMISTMPDGSLLTTYQYFLNRVYP